LYLWGGFAGRHGRNEPSLEVDGLVYDPKKDKWSRIEGPRDAEGSPVSTGGGCAATLPDGRIAIAGGVNKDIFLSALIDQASDYLNHPIGWYGFNPTVYVFNPADGSFSPAGTDPLFARAGAAAVATPEGNVLLIGGELKPRIRTNTTSTIRP
ncbi:MAG: cyclically-permuted mutarotase family protein, partial [Paramuribaculum sp.]|nr:cyclically-permuted mutarotase family protein [Paramuribaculum sp.]